MAESNYKCTTALAKFAESQDSSLHALTTLWRRCGASWDRGDQLIFPPLPIFAQFYCAVASAAGTLRVGISARTTRVLVITPNELSGAASVGVDINDWDELAEVML